MKFKIGVFSILIAVFMLASASLAFCAAGDVTATEVDLSATNTITPGETNIVIGKINLAAGGAAGNVSILSSITLDATVGSSTDLTAGDISRFAIYLDTVNAGKVLPSSVLLYEKTVQIDWAGIFSAATVCDITDFSITFGTDRKILIVVDAKKVPDTGGTDFDDYAVEVIATAGACGASPAATGGTFTGFAAGGGAVGDVPVVINPTHLVFDAAGYNVLSTPARELVSANRDFASVPAATNWTLAGGMTYNSSNQVAEATGVSSSATSLVYSNATFRVAPGVRYAVTFEVKSIATGQIRPLIGGVNGTYVANNGVYTQVITTTTGGLGNELKFETSSFIGAIDNVSVKEIPGSYGPISNELVTANGDFSAALAAADWTIGGGGWTYHVASKHVEILNAAIAAGDITYGVATLLPVAGKIYAVRFELKENSGTEGLAGNVTPKIGGTSGTLVPGVVGAYVQYITATDGTALTFSADGAFKGALDNVSVKEVKAISTDIAVTGNILKAVDDYDNLSKTYARDVKFKAEAYFTGASLSSTLTAIGGGTHGFSIKVGDAGADGTEFTADDSVPFVNGLLPAALTPTAGDVTSIASSTTGAVVLVAVDEWGLEGSVTISNTTTYTNASGIASARGIELYDTNHNGRLDRATLFFDQPVSTPGASTYYGVAGYVVAATPVPATKISNGGIGIRNAGEFGVTIYLTEITTGYDTNAKPEVTYAGGSILPLGGGSALSSVNAAQAVEVDRARPVLLSAYTRDNGLVGVGTASNGKLDGIEMTFSEPITGNTAGASSSYSLYINGSVDGFTFNQGNGTLTGTVLRIPVGETSINTGVVPTIYYEKAYPIKDSATNASGSSSPNVFYPTSRNTRQRLLCPWSTALRWWSTASRRKTSTPPTLAAVLPTDASTTSR